MQAVKVGLVKPVCEPGANLLVRTWCEPSLFPMDAIRCANLVRTISIPDGRDPVHGTTVYSCTVVWPAPLAASYELVPLTKCAQRYMLINVPSTYYGCRCFRHERATTAVHVPRYHCSIVVVLARSSILFE
eukprot:COSAG05_NODE_149_length_16213_cov_66.750279_8_plen_131_part_00